jgi:hypothetical protein
MRRRLKNPSLVKLQIVTRPTESAANPPARRRAHLSEHSAALIESVAKNSKNQALASALMRLAGRSRGQEQDG